MLKSIDVTNVPAPSKPVAPAEIPLKKKFSPIVDKSNLKLKRRNQSADKIRSNTITISDSICKNIKIINSVKLPKSSNSHRNKKLQE